MSIIKCNKTTINFDPFKSETTLVAGIYSSIDNMSRFYVFSDLDFARKIFQKKLDEFDFIDLAIIS